MLLGQNTLGKFGLGDFGSNPKVTLAGVFGTGVAGSIFPRAPTRNLATARARSVT
jgi:uncharacterized membrane protein (DUF441 family)